MSMTYLALFYQIIESFVQKIPRKELFSHFLTQEKTSEQKFLSKDAKKDA